MWAEQVDGNRCRLKNSPFFVRGVSFDDIIFVRPDRGGIPNFRGVSIRGGHSTYWVTLNAPRESSEFKTAWKALEALGCGFEGGGDGLLSVDVPPAADISEVYTLLEAGQVAGT